MSPSGVLPKAVESGEMLASENYSELYISDTCDVEKCVYSWNLRFMIIFWLLGTC